MDFPAGTPQRELQDVVSERFETAVAFFEAVADETNVQTKSAAGTFYAFLRLDRPLPDAHRAAYKRLLGATDELLDQIRTRARRERNGGHDRDAIEDLRREVAELRGELAALRREVPENQRSARPARGARRRAS